VQRKTSSFCRIKNLASRLPLCSEEFSDGKHAPGLLSLGTVYSNPFWLFYSSSELIDRFSQLKGKRIAVGPRGRQRTPPIISPH